jgi:hypothetical protein
MFFVSYITTDMFFVSQITTDIYWPVVFFFVNNSLISHELETDGIVITTQNISVVNCDTKNISVVIGDTNSISVVMCDTRTYPWLPIPPRCFVRFVRFKLLFSV